MTDDHTPEEELEIDGEDQDSGHDGIQGQDEDLDDELAEQEEEEEQERDAGPRSSAKLAPVRGAPAPAASTRTKVAHSEDELPYIDDRASKIWVGAIVAVFALILAYGLLFGKGGALTPPTPSPTPSPSPAATATGSIAPSPSLTVAPSVTATPLPSSTPAPASPTPSPS